MDELAKQKKILAETNKILKELKEETALLRQTNYGQFDELIKYARKRSHKMNGVRVFLTNISKSITKIAMHR